MSTFLSHSLNFSLFALLYMYTWFNTPSISGSNLTGNVVGNEDKTNCHTELIIHIDANQENSNDIKEDYNQVVCDDSKPTNVYYSYP